MRQSICYIGREDLLALNWEYNCQVEDMVVVKKKITESDEKEWEEPQDPGTASDARDKEQILRQYEEAKRRKDNLTEKDHIDKPKEN